MTFLTYAQNFEDLMLWRALKHVENGVFIDVGAMSPDEHTVTRAFHERGWRGINIEPNPAYLSQLQTRRPNDINLGIAISDLPGQIELNIFDDTGLSTVEEGVAKIHADTGLKARRVKVEVKTIAQVWSEHVPAEQDVHFLKVDVEGHEEQVLRGGDWAVNRPWILVVEATYPNTQTEVHEKWESILLKADYIMAYWDGLNRFYVAREHSELLDAFAAPPNVFDDYEIPYFSNRIRELAEDVKHLSAERSGTKALIKQLQDEATTVNTSLQAFRQENSALRTQIETGEQASLADEQKIQALRNELAYARSRAYREFGKYLSYKFLKTVLHSKLPLSERTRARYAASMNKRNPKRSLHVVDKREVTKHVAKRPEATKIVINHHFDFHGPLSQITNENEFLNTDALKGWYRQECLAELKQFLTNDERLAFSRPEAPKVSVVLVLYNQAELTLQCLKSLMTQSFTDFEVIICDNGSTDQTHDLLERLDGVHVVNNKENLHFLRGVNRAALDARGEHILLLNNDACVERKALEEAVQRLEDAPDVGAVGGPIILIDGSLQEAGNIVFADGRCEGYGRGRNPKDLEFQFRRDVDYCSGAFLLVRGSAWKELEGFDEIFAPAYYEEVDFCMRLRKHRYRVVFDPLVRILHFEFGSSSLSSTAIALQKKNHPTFENLHRDTLRRLHGTPSDSRIMLRERREAQPRLLFIDDRIPYPWFGAGAPRAAEMLQAIAENGWSSTFFPMADPHVDSEQAYKILPATTELITGELDAPLSRFLNERVGCFDAILVSRPHNMKKFLDAIAADPSVVDGIQLIYDAEALFSERDRKLAELTGRSTNDFEGAVRAELALADIADVIFSVSEPEAQKFRGCGHKDVRVLSHGLVTSPLGNGPETRQNALFVGRLLEDFSPNTDSLVWFVETIMPLIDARIGTNWSLDVAGMAGPKVRGLASDRVKILDRVDDLDALYARSRLFIAPTRYSAGIPLKILEAASKGLPVVSTQALADQLEWSNSFELMSSDTADGFAERFATLWTDDALWRSLRETALGTIARNHSRESFIAEFNAVLKSFH